MLKIEAKFSGHAHCRRGHVARPWEVVETATTRLSPVPLQNHSLGGCTINMMSAGDGRSFRRAIPCFIQSILYRIHPCSSCCINQPTGTVVSGTEYALASQRCYASDDRQQDVCSARLVGRGSQCCRPSEMRRRNCEVGLCDDTAQSTGHAVANCCSCCCCTT